MTRRGAVDLQRRRLLLSSTAWAGVSAFVPWSVGRAIAAKPSGTPFSFGQLVEKAKALAKQPYRAPPRRDAQLLGHLDYDFFMGIHTRPGRALWANSALPFSVEMFPLDNTAPDPVALYIVDQGMARPLRYDPSIFSYDNPKVASKLPKDLGYAGFRLLERRTGVEWLAFKGASYFRSPAALNQYGMSARGLAVNTGESYPESFPRFSAFWIARPQPGDDAITIYALLEGEHITGAYRMRCQNPGDVIMDIETRLFQRSAVERLGIAPLTSMYWFSETNARFGTDWRPEVHDSDGLAITTGQGEHIWRALDNPPRADYSAFYDENPRGFGLLQRDRQFDDYQDPAVRYERRPSTWIQPKGDWGKGEVGLFELPTSEEIYDNINVFWVPQRRAAAGSAWQFDYRLYWCAREPDPSPLARVVATRTGRAGKPGNYDKQPPLARKFVIDFVGGPLADLAPDTRLVARARASRGEIVNPYTVAVSGTRRWRAFFDWRGPRAPHGEPVVLHCEMTHKDRVITESWVYSYFPRPLP